MAKKTLWINTKLLLLQLHNFKKLLLHQLAYLLSLSTSEFNLQYSEFPCLSASSGLANDCNIVQNNRYCGEFTSALCFVFSGAIKGASVTSS